MVICSSLAASHSLVLCRRKSLSSFALRNAQFRASSSIAATTKLAALPRSADSFNFNPLRFSVKYVETKKTKRGSRAVCSASPVPPHNLRWISAIASVYGYVCYNFIFALVGILMISKGTAIHKSFLAPIFLLQAPSNIISWIKGEYGLWSAFLAILVRLFFHIPGELELPLLAVLMVIIAPGQVMRLRESQEGTIIALVLAAYLAFQHFSRSSSLSEAFDKVSIIASFAVVCITIVSFLLLI